MDEHWTNQLERLQAEQLHDDRKTTLHSVSVAQCLKLEDIFAVPKSDGKGGMQWVTPNWLNLLLTTATH